MAVLDFEGFDHGGTGIASGVDITVVAEGRNSGYCAKITGFADTIVFGATAAAATDSFIVGYAVQVALVGVVADFLQVQRGGTTDDIHLDLAADGSITVEVGTTDVGSTAAGAIVAATWHYIEVEWLSHASTGVLKLRIDGNTPSGWTDITSADTQDATGTSLIYNCTVGIGGNAYNTLVDDIYMLDSSGASSNAFLGDVRVPYLPVTSQTSANFVGSDADSINNHLLLDEVPQNVTDYVESSTVTDRDVYGLTALGLTGTPYGVKASLFGLDTASASQSLEIDLVSGVVADTTTLALPGSASFISGDITTVDPDGGGALTTAIVDALELAIEVA